MESVSAVNLTFLGIFDPHITILPAYPDLVAIRNSGLSEYFFTHRHCDFVTSFQSFQYFKVFSCLCNSMNPLICLYIILSFQHFKISMKNIRIMDENPSITGLGIDMGGKNTYGPIDGFKYSSNIRTRLL